MITMTIKLPLGTHVKILMFILHIFINPAIFTAGTAGTAQAVISWSILVSPNQPSPKWWGPPHGQWGRYFICMDMHWNQLVNHHFPYQHCHNWGVHPPFQTWPNIIPNCLKIPCNHVSSHIISHPHHLDGSKPFKTYDETYDSHKQITHPPSQTIGYIPHHPPAILGIFRLPIG